MFRLLNLWVSLQFRLRARYFSRVKIRRKDASAPAGPAVQAEREFYHLALERAFAEGSTNNISAVIDVGCRNWSYARALADYFPAARLFGVEIDGGRRYWSLYRRMDFAQAYADELAREGKATSCHFEDFRKLRAADFAGIPERHRRIAFCMFFPFVSRGPCLSWGLPEEYASYPDLLAHSRSLAVDLAANPCWISLHQGEWEAQIALEAYAKAGLKVATHAILEPVEFAGLWPSRHDVHVISACQ